LTNLIKIDNEYVKAEIKGEDQVIFKIATAIAKICEEIKIGEKKEKKRIIKTIFKRLFTFIFKIKNFCLDKGIYHAVVVIFYYLNYLACRFLKIFNQNKSKDNHSEENVVKREFLDFISYDISDIKVILEIGSRDAIQSIEFSRIFPHAKIYAFECYPPSIKKCVENVKNLKNIEIIPYAISNKNGKRKFFPVIINVGASSLYETDKTFSFFRNQPQQEIEVDTIRVDRWAKEKKINRIDLCWIDLQGGEYEAFEGMGDLIYGIQAIYTEVEYKRIYKDQKLFRDIYKFLKRKGFFLIKNSPVGNFWWGNAIFVNYNLYKKGLNKEVE